MDSKCSIELPGGMRRGVYETGSVDRVLEQLREGGDG